MILKPINIDELLTEVKRRLTTHPHEAETILQKGETGATPSDPGSTGTSKGKRVGQDSDEDGHHRQGAKKGSGI